MFIVEFGFRSMFNSNLAVVFFSSDTIRDCSGRVFANSLFIGVFEDCFCRRSAQSVIKETPSPP